MSRLKHFLLRRPRLCRLAFNWWPPFWGTGLKVLDIAADFSAVKIKLCLRFYNKNYIGAHFGGSLYSVTDPFYTLMVSQTLGPAYFVCDKSASIDYLRLGQHHVIASMQLTPQITSMIVQQVASAGRSLPQFEIDLIDEVTGALIAKVKRTLYVRKQR